MNQDSKPATFNLPLDVYERLKGWAKQNRTSMVAELIRATRERAAREKEAA